MAPLAIQRIRPSIQGADTDSSPEYLSELHGERVINLIPRGGSLRMRGSYVNIASYLSAANTNILFRGLMVFDDNFLVGLDPGGSEHFNLTTSVQTNIADAPPILSRRHARVEGFVYCAGRESNSGDQLLRWPGGAVAPTALALGTAPRNALDVVEHLNRLFVLGGDIGASGGRHSIMWSDPGGTTGAGVLTDWQDNTTGLTNVIQVGAVDNDTSVGLGKVDRSLAIFKKRSLYVLSGQTPSTFQVRRFSDQIGCVSRDTICSHNDGCYFLSDRGLMYFDGAQLTEASKPVRTDLQNAIRTVQLQTSPYYSVENIGRGCLMVLVGDLQGAPGTQGFSGIIPRFQYIYDTARDAWVEVCFGGTSLSPPSEVTGSAYMFKPQAVFWASGRPVISDGNQFGYADNLVFPEAGGSFIGRDFILNPATMLQGNKMILSEWNSRILRLASPGQKSQLHRVMLDYMMVTGTAVGWHVYLVQDNGSVNTALFTGDTANTGGTTERDRAVFDTFAECEEIQLRVTWPDPTLTSTPTTAIGSIMDAHIEYQPAARRTG